MAAGAKSVAATMHNADGQVALYVILEVQLFGQLSKVQARWWVNATMAVVMPRCLKTRD
jgi:hypothetical protein